MPAKKRPLSTGKLFKKPKPLGKVSAFPCPNPDDPLTLQEIVDRMQVDSAFARFISRLLCASYSDKKAKACLDSYYKPTTDELTGLCIPKKYHKMMMVCTVTTPNDLLIVMPARIYSQPGG
ncbi:MAG: hypothetical protein QOJ45_101 [Verrucomicrobiota bacterium]|jgi:hypothetical protein